ncbi:MAG TPA: ABC-type transport auxiliary lipoprotein family protein, partial [Steroidobacteraceae bacterium]|nr:ABC-type transport auxiliary lipoprotein family protein [Steroidobacteraceae bacterium]
MTGKLKLTASSLAALGALAGCSGLFRSDAKPEQTYVLRAPAGKTGGATPIPAATDSGAPASSSSGALAVLQVAHPLSAPGLEGPHIMLVQADHRMNFYLGSRWPGPVTDVVESLVVDTLRASGEWQTVEDSGSPFAPEYLLQISVRRFEADYTAGGAGPSAVVVLDCTLGARSGRRLIASFVA